MRQVLLDTCVAAARAGLRWEVQVDGRRSMMPAGHNGPYFHVETPLRNTAHWLVTYAVAHRATGEPRYREIGTRLSAFLQDPGRYRGQYALVHRQTASDGSNGVIGPAWVIEALARAATHLGDEAAGAMASSELAELPFEGDTGAWRRVDPVTGPGHVDYTYNHQAWLAAAAADVPDASGRDLALRFLDRSAAGSFRVGKDGIIRHVLHASTARGRLLLARFGVLRRLRSGAIRAKEHGYHLYALLPLLRLRTRFPGHALFGSHAFGHAVETAMSIGFRDGLRDNRFAYPYNAPGFEMPMLATLPGAEEELILKSLQQQNKRTLDAATGLHTRGTPDPATLAARTYEIALAAETLERAEATHG